MCVRVCVCVCGEGGRGSKSVHLDVLNLIGQYSCHSLYFCNSEMNGRIYFVSPPTYIQ